MDNGIVEEPQLQLTQESSSRLKGNLPPENVPHAITFPQPQSRNVSYKQIPAEKRISKFLYSHYALSSYVQGQDVLESYRRNLLLLDAWDVFARIGNPR